MIRLHEDGMYLVDGVPTEFYNGHVVMGEARTHTIAHGILAAHDESGGSAALRLQFDALASHDITYVNVIQTARASGLTRFPAPYVLTNCHNSLCAVGGTINEDDHAFGLSAAVKYGGVYVPAHLAVIHTYMREMVAAAGQMALGTDSHTRYGALGCMGIGEGGGEMVKQLLGKRYEIHNPDVVGVYVTGEAKPGVGPHDVALALIKATFADGFVKNRVLEFIGDGIHKLSVDFRNALDVMTTETACLSSIWQTDEKVRAYYQIHGREGDYRELKPGAVAYYDRFITLDLSKAEPMIALPFHPSNAYTIRELNADEGDILRIVEADAEEMGISLKLQHKAQGGRLTADQGSIVGCAGGTYENIMAAAAVLKGKSIGSGQFALSVYPGSQPIMMALTANGAANDLMAAGAVLRTAFCGPCFGAGDVPQNGGLSLRHATRNFQSREGAKPGDGQLASVALMDARSIAATAANGGRLTGADEIHYADAPPAYRFRKEAYDARVYDGWSAGARTGEPLVFGPNIADWPEMAGLTDDILIKIAAFITDPVTTTDELIPSGETSSYRSNPLKLAEFTLSRKAPGYAAAAKAVLAAEEARQRGEDPETALPELAAVYKQLAKKFKIDKRQTAVGTAVYAVKPGDGSAREQAASCQRVLGGLANICQEYATKRYMSNLMNWGMLPFTIDAEPTFAQDSYIYIPGARQAVEDGAATVTGHIAGGGEITLNLPEMTAEQRRVLLAGNLMLAERSS